VKDPRTGRLKAVEADPEGEVAMTKEIYRDMASWIDPMQLEASLRAAAKAKSKRAATGGGEWQVSGSKRLK
jgi:hypothetical protein